MSGLLTHLAEAKIRDAKTEIEGKILTRPALLIADGLGSATYGCDVDINMKSIDAATGQEVIVPLRNVPIASGVHELLYADVDAAVTLRRSPSGRYEIVGFSKRKPGTYVRIPVTIPEPSIGPLPYVIGDRMDFGLTVRVLEFGQLATLGGGFGIAPFGAVGVFRGGTLIEVRT